VLIAVPRDARCSCREHAARNQVNLNVEHHYAAQT
jgi:hypothetical protein